MGCECSDDGKVKCMFHFDLDGYILNREREMVITEENDPRIKGIMNMYEFWFTGMPKEPFNFTGSTSDFLEVICQITKAYGSFTAAIFVHALMDNKGKDLDFLRITEWTFTWINQDNDQQEIKLTKL